MKNSIKLLLSGAILLSLLISVTALTRASVISYVGKCGDNATYTVYDDGLVTVNGYGDTTAPFFDCPEAVKEVTVSNGVTSIAYNMFCGCGSLTSANIPDSVKSIGSSAFERCLSLDGIHIPKSVKTISDSAFSGCTSLRWLILDNGIGNIKNAAFSGCTSLTSVTVPKSVTMIGNNAFAGCASLKSVVLPDNLRQIGTDVFDNCPCIETVTLPQFVLNKNYNTVFSGASNIKNVILSDNVYVIPDGTFKRSVTDSVYSKPCGSGLLRSVALPSSLKSIGADAFEGQSELTEISLPESLEAIGDAAFAGCDGLKYIFYEGSRDEFEKISVGDGNPCLSSDSIVIHYGCRQHTESKADCMKPTVCTVCGYEISPARGRHTFTEYVSDGNATCTEDGTETAKCDICGAVNTKRDEGSALHHDLIYHNGKPATCTEDGYLPYVTCSRRDYSTYEVIPALGHDFSDEWTVDKKAAPGVRGEKSKHCKRCGARDDITVIEYLSFTDIKPTDWYYDAVSFVIGRNLFLGTGNGKFDPKTAMSRGMLVTVLWRMEGSPRPRGASPFTDLRQNWYRDAVIWAYENRVVDGTGNTTFSPDLAITREQMAKIFMSYAKYKKYDVSRSTALDFFPDRKNAHDWALESLSWAVSEGLISGSDGKLLPSGTATRAQVATILMRFCTRYRVY